MLKNIVTHTIPKEIIHKILLYDGQIRYDYRAKKYINILHKSDPRYKIIHPVQVKKIKEIRYAIVEKTKDSFSIQVKFNKHPHLGLYYASGGWSSRAFTQQNKIETCFYNIRKGIYLHMYL